VRFVSRAFKARVLTRVLRRDAGAQPRKGAFEVRVAGVEAPLVSLLVRTRGGAARKPRKRVSCCDARSQPHAHAMTWRAQALPRPFTKLRELDFDKAAADVLAALP
jgi:hypothetical protein